MIRRMAVVIALLTATGCSSGTAGPALEDSSPTAFAGTWRSVTPSYEFMGLSVYSTSSQVGVLAARLTFSGIAWDGAGRIAGDSVVADMTMSGTGQPSGVLVAHVRDARTLGVSVRPVAGAAIELTFVREE